MLFFTNRGSSSLYFSTANIPSRKTVNKKKIRKGKKEAIKTFLCLYYNQAKCVDIANKNPNAADDDERTLNYRWPEKVSYLNN